MALVYSTPVGGTSVDIGRDVAVDPSGDAHVVGEMSYTELAGSEFPTKNALQPSAQVPGQYAFALRVAHPACGEEVTGAVDLLQIGYFHLPFTPLRLAFVLLHNRSSGPIQGPLAYVMDDLQHGVFVGSQLITRCVSPEGDPVMLVGAGADQVFSPGEVLLTGVWFYQTDTERIVYTPRILSGVPSR